MWAALSSKISIISTPQYTILWKATFSCEIFFDKVGVVGGEGSISLQMTWVLAAVQGASRL